MMVSIRVENLVKRMGGASALDGVTAAFEGGKLHGLIGPDGAGKTTLIRMIMGLLGPDSGRMIYSLDEREVPFGAVRPRMAYMPQQPSLYPDLSSLEHLEFFRDLYEVPEEVYVPRRDKLLHLTRLDAFKDRPAGKLSGGMYKKLGLMCALLQSPLAVVLDEPTNGVDPISRREFWELLYGLVGEGILVLVSTAYMDEAERCGKVHLMEAGRMLGEGEPRAVLEKASAGSFEEFFLRRAAEGA